eukprot:7546580-Pyramimonas_sp.AAC.1
MKTIGLFGEGHTVEGVLVPVVGLLVDHLLPLGDEVERVLVRLLDQPESSGSQSQCRDGHIPDARANHSAYMGIYLEVHDANVGSAVAPLQRLHPNLPERTTNKQETL